MTPLEMKPQIIEVTGEEAKLVQAAELVDLNAERRTLAETPAGKLAPITFLETEQERAIMSQYMKLCSQYQMAYGLPCPPILIAKPDYVPIQKEPTLTYQKYTQRFMTDMELADLLMQRVILCRKGKTVYLYNGTHYVRLSEDKLRTLIKEKLREELSVRGSSSQLKGVVEAITAEPTIEKDDIGNIRHGLCLQNGILDVSTFTLYEHSPQYNFTWKMPVNWLRAQPCPVFDGFLNTVTGGDPILTQRFWEAIGYVLVPYDNNAKRFILMIDYGDTGKSVLGELLRSFFEPSSVGSVDIFRMGDRFSLSTLVHKLVNISMDLSDSALNEQAISIIKQITGRDLVQVEEKYITPYAAEIKCKLVFGTNHQLRIGSQDRAFANRILYLPFNYPIPVNQQDRLLLDKLLNERSGILYKALFAYRTLVSNGYVFSGDDRYNLVHAYQPAEETVSQTDTLEQFTRECCMEDMGGFVPTDILYQSYLQFCQIHQRGGIDNKQIFSAKFNAIIRQMYPAAKLSKKRINGVPSNGYQGISLC